MPKAAPQARWILLFHQLPPKPAYLRVKTSRHLARIGALALKNTVYALPYGDAAVEHMQWVRREIVDGGGDATVVEARLLDGLTDAEAQGLFRDARDADYQAIARDARVAAKALGKRAAGGDADARVARLERRLQDVAAIDFFGAAGRETAAGLVAALRRRVAPRAAEKPEAATWAVDDYRGRTWVTRAGVHVDRIASAWLVRRFVDPHAKLKFVAPKGYVPARGELRFDMYEAELTHEGDRCTFEVMLRRFGLDAPGLAAVGEVVHDIDLRDEKFGRAETAGVAALIAGTALRHEHDEDRIAAGSAIFESLTAYYARKGSR